MIQGQSIRIQFSAKDGKPLRISDILLLIQFSANGNYCYEFEIGRTDVSGRLTVSYGDVEKRRSAGAVEFPKDYSTRLEDCDAAVKIVVPSEKELIARMRKVNEDYGRPPDWAAPWPSNARIKPQEKTIDLTEKTVEVHLAAI
jgi:hypothetical protein